MDRLARRRRRCWVAGLTAAGLIVSAACGTGPRTDGEPGHEGMHGGVEFTGGGHHTLLVTDDFPPPGEPNLVLRVSKGPLPHKKNSPVEHDWHIKINARPLEGVADVKLPCDVRKSGYVSVCSGPDFAEVLEHGRTWGIRVAANEETEVGETGDIMVTAFGENYTMWPDGAPPVRFDVTVSSGLEPTGLADAEDVGPGDVFRTRMGFTNKTSAPVDRAVLRYVGTRGLSFPERYRNCSYGRKQLDRFEYRQEMHATVCTFEGPFEPGGTYRLAEPVEVRAADFGHLERLGYRFYPGRHREVPGLDDGAGFRNGDGGLLRLEQGPLRTDQETAPLDEAVLVRGTRYDLSVTGEEVRGPAGDTAAVDLVLRNHGPARFAPGRPDDSRGSVIPGYGAVLVLGPPEGATVTGVPDGCTPVTKGFRRIAQDHKWFHTFACPVENALLPGETVEHRFRLHLDDAQGVARMRAKIRFGVWFPERTETGPANNRTRIVLDGS